jgi:hypothetical protein
MQIFIKIKDCIRRIRLKYIHSRLRNTSVLYIQGRTLIVAPHPDDEVLGCGGLITRLAMKGQPPYVIVMTGGGASHMGCCELPDDVVVENRRRLTLRALTILGVPEKNIFFLDFQDGRIDDKDSEMVALQSLLSNLNPEQVFVPHRSEGWSDHVWTARIIKSLIPAAVKVWEYCVWFWYYNTWNMDWKQARILKLDARIHALKHKAIDAYITPLAPCGNPWSGVLPKVFIDANSWNKELFFKVK